MAFSTIISGVGTATGSSQLIDLSAYSAIPDGAVVKISNTSDETLAFQLVASGGSTTLGGARVTLLGPKEVDELDFNKSSPYLAYIGSSGGTFNYSLGQRKEKI